MAPVPDTCATPTFKFIPVPLAIINYRYQDEINLHHTVGEIFCYCYDTTSATYE